MHDDDDDLPSHFSPDPEQAAFLAQLMADARRWVPEDFDIDTFWYEVLGDLDLSMTGKLNLIQQMIEGEVPFEEVLELRAELAECVERWNSLLGEETAEAVRGVVRRFSVNPRDVSAMTALPPGDSDEDAAIQLFAFTRLAGAEEVTAAERVDMLRRAAAARPTLPGIQRTLSRMFIMMGVAAAEPAERQALLREALKWITRAQRQDKDDPALHEDVAYTLEELIQALGGNTPESKALVPRLAEHYEAALRLADEADETPERAVRALHGIALTNWRLAMWSDDPDECRRLLEVALAQVRQAIERAEGDERASLESSAGGLALEIAWLPGEPEERRRLFEASLRSFAAMSPDEESDARHHEGVALVGLATLADAAERGELVARATALFALPPAGEPEDGTLDRSEARAWLRLAGATEGDERRTTAGWAVTAARRGVEREPGHLEGTYDLACALTLAGELEEAARQLAAVAERDGALAKEALDDPDLAPLFAERPDLRAGLEALGTTAPPRLLQ